MFPTRDESSFETADSTAGMSAGTHTSCGGYSGDQSSISDLSSDRRGRTKTNTHRHEGSTERAIVARDGGVNSGEAMATQTKDEMTRNAHEAMNLHGVRLEASRKIEGKIQTQNTATLEAKQTCRPFPQDDVPPPLPPEQPPVLPTDAASQKSESSGGFTFFGSGSGGSFSESIQNQANAANRESALNHPPPIGREIAERVQSSSKDGSDGYISDSSSMIVLTRVKRKRPDQIFNTGSSNYSRKKSDLTKGTLSVSVGTVAIGNAVKHCSHVKFLGSHFSTQVAEDGRQQQQPAEGSSGMSSVSQSLYSSGSDSGSKKIEANCNTEVSSNTNSKAQRQPNIPTVSSFGTTPGVTIANGSSGSGTGRGNENNTRSKPEPVSGGGNSDEQKVTEEHDSASGTDCCRCKPIADPKLETEQQVFHEGNCHGQSVNRNANHNQSVSLNQEIVEAVSEAKAETFSKEKMIAKKRKRMNMRKEYEAAVCCERRDSSAISHEETTVLEPGQPVTLEQVLSFGKQARLLVQAFPPFLVVHVNAAFTRLCGIQSSLAIGTPVASIISTVSRERDCGSDNSSKKDILSSLSGDGNSRNDAIQAFANNSVMQVDTETQVNDNTFIPSIAGLRIDHLIAARGYGHVQDVEVMFLPHPSHSHAIEGSEVEFVKGEKLTQCSEIDHLSKILCRMSVSPVLSAEHGYTDIMSPHQSRSNDRRRFTTQKLKSVKHYLIQLEAADGPRFLVSRTLHDSSSTDATIVAQVLGITKTDVYARRGKWKKCQVQKQVEEFDQRGIEESHDENASSTEPVITCG